MQSDHQPETALVEQISRLELEIARLARERDQTQTAEARQAIQKQLDDLVLQARELREKLPR